MFIICYYSGEKVKINLYIFSLVVDIRFCYLKYLSTQFGSTKLPYSCFESMISLVILIIVDLYIMLSTRAPVKIGSSNTSCQLSNVKLVVIITDSELSLSDNKLNYISLSLDQMKCKLAHLI